MFRRKVDLQITRSVATVSASLQINSAVGPLIFFFLFFFSSSTFEVKDTLLVLCNGIFQQLSLLSGVKPFGRTLGLTFYSRSEL